MSDPGDIAAPPEYYADAFTIAWSPFGVDVTFGRDIDPETGIRNPRAVIAMSPELAKALGDELQRVSSIREAERSDRGEPA